jgi:hypothetical protein
MPVIIDGNVAGARIKAGLIPLFLSEKDDISRWLTMRWIIWASKGSEYTFMLSAVTNQTYIVSAVMKYSSKVRAGFRRD